MDNIPLSKKRMIELMEPLQGSKCLDTCTLKLIPTRDDGILVSFVVCQGHFDCLSDILTHLAEMN